MEWVIYFLGIADKVETVAFLAMCIIGLALLLICVMMFGEASSHGWDDDDVKLLRRWFRHGICAFAVALGIFFVVPNSKNIAAMYVVPAITQNEQLKNISENSLKALEQLTQKWIQDLIELKNK